MATTSSGVVTPGIDMGAGDSWDAPPPEQRQINAPFNADDPRLVYKPTAGDQSAATLGSALGTKLPAIPGAAPALPTGAPPVRAPAAPAIPQQTLPEMAADSSKILASKDANQMLQAQLKAQQQSGEEERKAHVQEKENIALRLKQQGEADSLIADRKTAAIQKHQADLQESSPFAPTQESAGDLAKLFSLLSVAAFSSGGKGKYAGMQAMSAMTGAMKGYKQGQKEVYDKEVKNFEENLKVLKTHNDKIDKIYNDAMELMAVDKDKGIQKMRELIAEDNTGIAKQLAQSGRYKELGDVISTARKSVMEADKIVQARKEKLSDRAEERSYQAAKLKEEHRYQEEKARIVAAAKGAGGGGGAAAGSVERMTQSMGQAADALTNLSNLPIATRSPIYGQHNFDSLFTAPLGVLNQAMTNDATQFMKTRMAGVSRSLASLETGGAATGLVGLTKSIDDGIAIPAGSSPAVALDKLAEMRRIVETAGRIALSSPKYNQSQKDEIQKNIDFVRQAIPYTQKDLDNALRGVGKNGVKIPKEDRDLSFTEFVTKHGVGQEVEKPVPTQTDLDHVKAHPEDRAKFVEHFGREP